MGGSAAELIRNFRDLSAKPAEKSDAKIQFLFQPVVELPKAPVPLSIDTTEAGEEESKKQGLSNPRLSSDCITRLNSSPKNSEVMSRIQTLYEQHQERKKVLEHGLAKGMRHCASHQNLPLAKAAAKPIAMKPNVSKKTTLISSVKGGKKKSIRVEVGIAPGRKETIVLQQGDSIPKVVEAFCKEHSLDNFTKNKLVAILSKHTRELTNLIS